MNIEETLQQQLKKINALLEDCYSYLDSDANINKARLTEIIAKNLKLRDKYVEKLKAIKNKILPDIRNKQKGIDHSAKKMI